MSDSSGESKDASTFVPFDVQEEIRNLDAVRELFRVINEGYNIETGKTLETEFKSALVALQSLTGHNDLKDAIQHLTKEEVPILLASAFAMRGILDEIEQIQTKANVRAGENIRDLVTEDELSEDEEA